MPLITSNNINSTFSHRRNLSSKSLAINTSKSVLNSTRGQISPRTTTLGKKRATEIEFSNITGDISIGGKHGEQEVDMTFLQYCTTCDKQILVPNSSILYCSESCRRKDSISTTPPAEFSLSTRPSSLFLSPTSPINKLEMNPFDDPEQTRLAPATTSTSLPLLIAKPAELHNHKPDLDPTEWKPNSSVNIPIKPPVSASIPLDFSIPNLLPEEVDEMDTSETTVQDSNDKNKRPDLESRRQSAAFSYLAQFHRSASSFLSLNSKRTGLKSRQQSAVSVPALGRANTSESLAGTPAMSLSYSTSGSSVLSATSSTESLGLCVADTHGNGNGTGIGTIVTTGGLAFGKQAITSVDAVGLHGVHTVDGAAEGSLRGLLARAA